VVDGCSWTAAAQPDRWTTSTASGSTTRRTLRACSCRRRAACCSTATRSTSSSRTSTDVSSTPSSIRSASAIRLSRRCDESRDPPPRRAAKLKLTVLLPPIRPTTAMFYCAETVTKELEVKKEMKVDFYISPIVSTSTTERSDVDHSYLQIHHICLSFV